MQESLSWTAGLGHCGFVINDGTATAADIAELIQEVSETVKEKFGVTLEPEVILLGDF